MTNTNTNSKVTKLDVVKMMLANELISSNKTFKAYLENEKSLLERKRDNKKATKTQTENEVFKSKIVAILSEAEKPMTVGELIKSDEVFADFSTPKMSALVKSLKDNGIVARTVEKGKAVFSLV